MNMKIVASALVITAVLSGGMLYHSHHVVTENAKSEKVIKAHTNKINDKTANLSVSSMKSAYDAEYPNLDKIESKNSSQINKAMKLAFNDSTTQSDFNSNKSKITDLLGNSIGDKVLNITKPQANQSSLKPKSISAKMTGCNVSYGQFNQYGGVIPFEAIVKFDTPPVDPNAGTDLHAKHTKIVSHKAIAISGYLNTSNGSMTLNHEKDTLDQNND